MFKIREGVPVLPERGAETRGPHPLETGQPRARAEVIYEDLGYCHQCVEEYVPSNTLKSFEDCGLKAKASIRPGLSYTYQFHSTAGCSQQAVSQSDRGGERETCRVYPADCGVSLWLTA